MWRPCRIASAQGGCSRRQHWDTTTERTDNISGYGCPDDANMVADAEEAAKLFLSVTGSGPDDFCHGRKYDSSSCLCGLPFKLVNVRKEFTTSLHHLFSSHFQKNLRSCCEAAKRNFIVSFTNPVLCFKFGPQSQQSEEDSTVTEKIRACLLNVGIHVDTSVLNFHRKFSLNELRFATSDFAEKNILGKGSSGCVYRGTLASSGLTIAVKALNVRLKDARSSFVIELETMCRVHDRHIQPLLGYCVEPGHLLLVYTYMPGGSLESWLYCNQTKGARGRPKLSWKDRCKVAMGITRALHYLHTECKPPIIHRDVKASNILLNKSNEAKLTDFGLAVKATVSNSVCKDVVGTFGYVAPEYFQSGRVSTKVDIYSLGIVLLELMTGRQPIDNNLPVGEGNLAIWARHFMCKNRGCIVAMADPVLGASYSSTGMQRLLCIAALCIHPLDAHRPCIGKVLTFMRDESAIRLRWLVKEVYRDASFSLRDNLTFASDQDHKNTRENEDRRKHYLKMAMQDLEEHSSLLHTLSVL